MESINDDILNEVLSEVNSDLVNTRKKQNEVYADKIERQYDEMLKRKEEEVKAKEIDLSVANPERVRQIQSSNEEYLTLAKQAKIFINEHFKGKIPYFPRNLILIAAQTGDGKSTTSANLTAHALKQNQKVLVLTNEENVSDVYNRVTCLCRGWSYANHGNFSEEQVKEFNRMIGVLSNRMTVVDNSFNGSLSQTTSLEGIEGLLSSLVEKKIEYDLIILDYYQNVSRSIKNPQLKDWEVQGRLSKFLDGFKNAYNAPIVVLAQQKPSTDGLSFKESLEGRKAILNVATCAIELKAERDLRRTGWTIKKSRFAETVGETIYTGYDRGNYVLYSDEFKNMVQIKKAQEEQNKLMGRVNPTNLNQGVGG